MNTHTSYVHTYSSTISGTFVRSQASRILCGGEATDEGTHIDTTRTQTHFMDTQMYVHERIVRAIFVQKWIFA